MASSLQILQEDFPSGILPGREVDVVARREDGFDAIPGEDSLAALPRPVHPNRLRKERSQFVSQYAVPPHRRSSPPPSPPSRADRFLDLDEIVRDFPRLLRRQIPSPAACDTPDPIVVPVAAVAAVAAPAAAAPIVRPPSSLPLLPPPHHAVDHAQQFLRPERFRQVPLGPGAVPDDAIGDHRPRGEEDRGHVPERSGTTALAPPALPPPPDR